MEVSLPGNSGICSPNQQFPPLRGRGLCLLRVVMVSIDAKFLYCGAKLDIRILERVYLKKISKTFTLDLN